MVMLVTLDQARNQVKVDNTEDDNRILGAISAASEGILNYIKDENLAYVGSYDSSGVYVPDIDSAGEMVVRDVIQQSVLIMVGVLYTDPVAMQFIEEGAEERLGKMSLPRAVHWLLDGAGRKPTLA